MERKRNYNKEIHGQRINMTVIRNDQELIALKRWRNVFKICLLKFIIVIIKFINYVKKGLLISSF